MARVLVMEDDEVTRDATSWMVREAAPVRRCACVIPTRRHVETHGLTSPRLITLLLLALQPGTIARAPPSPPARAIPWSSRRTTPSGYGANASGQLSDHGERNG